MSETQQGELLVSEAQTTLVIVRPGDVLFVMPMAGEFWVTQAMERIQAIVQERLPDARVIVLPNAATFAAIAVESRDDAHEP